MGGAIVTLALPKSSMTRSEQTAPDQMTAVLDSIARLIAQGELSESELKRLLAAATEPRDSAALSAAQRWVTVLQGLHRIVESTRMVAIDSLLLCGLPEDAVLRAVDTVVGLQVPGTTDTAPATESVEPVACSVQRLDLGTVRPGQPARAEMEVQGGPGRILADAEQLAVKPVVFGPAPTRVQLEAAAQPAGVLLTSVKLVTPRETQDIPVFARWQEAPAAKPAAVRSGSLTSGQSAAPAAPVVVVRTQLIISRVMGFPRALALQRAIEQIPGVVAAKALSYEQETLNLQVQHDAMLNLAERITGLPGFPLTMINSSLGRLQLVMEGR